MAFVDDPFRDELQTALAPSYRIERELTGGGMSRVFVAVEHALNRSVVVKVLKPELAAGVNRDRFRREIMVVAQLHHPHIVPVLSAGEHEDLLWYTMPFVEGESLREAIARGDRFTPREVGRVLHDVLDALAYAHRRGVIHRDIKPANILRHGTHSLVTDFGVAKALSAALPHSGTTSVGIAIGTPAYMAPEQLAADPNADHRMDLYAVGLLAYELLTGVQPFSGSSPQATMAAQLTRMPTPLEECCPGVPRELAALVMRLLAKQPADRPPTAAAALEEVETFVTPSAVTAPTAASVVATQSSSPAPASTASRWRMALVTAGVLVIAGLGVLVARQLNKRQPSAQTSVAAAVPTVDSARSVQVPLPSALTRADSFRIAAAVRAGVERARRVDAQRPGADRNLDSLQRMLVRVYTDSALQEARVALKALTATGQISRTVDSALANAARARRLTPHPVVVGPGGATSTAPSAARRTAAAPRARPFARARRVAVLPVRDGTARPELSPITRTLEDSLRRALTAAGYTLAGDAELVRLLAQPELVAQRREAEATGIGAVVTIVLSKRGDEIIAQAIVLDVWRGQPLSEREAADLDKPSELLGVVRDVSRALERVSWRSRADPRRVLVFDFDNQTGVDSLALVARQLADSVRAAIRKQLGVEIVSDAEARATTDANERRAVAGKLGVGAAVAGALTRPRGDSVSLRLSSRDMSEDRTFNTFEIRFARAAPFAPLPAVIERLVTDLAQVNWGPKAAR